MQVTRKETYKVVRAILTEKRFKQTQISEKADVTFSLVNRIVNWLVSLGYVARRKGHYELVSPGAIFSLFPLYRQLKRCETFRVDKPPEEVMKMMEKKTALCLISALSHYSDYYRDPAIYAYITDESIVELLQSLPEGRTHIALFREDLNGDDFVKEKGVVLTSKIRTIMDLYCANRSYAAEYLIRREYLR